MTLTQGREGGPALLGMCAEDGAGHLPVWVGSQPAQAALSRGEHGVVALPSGFQVRPLACSLSCLDDQGQFEQKCWRLLVRGLSLPTCFGAHQPLTLLCVERLFQS